MTENSSVTHPSTSPLAGTSDPVEGSALATEAAVVVIDRAAVEKVIDIMRPAIQADEGDIFLRGVDLDTGVVSVELTGACVTCPVSTATLKDGIERILKKRVEGVTSVEHVGAELTGAETGTAVSL